MPHIKNVNEAGFVVDLLGQPMQVGDFVVFGKTGQKTVVGEITKFTGRSRRHSLLQSTPPDHPAVDYVNVTVRPAVTSRNHYNQGTRSFEADRQIGVEAHRVVRLPRESTEKALQELINRA